MEGKIMTNQEAAREFEDTLGLDSCLIGVKYSKESDPKGETEKNLLLVKLLMSSEGKE
jgi:hypothetical protein